MNPNHSPAASDALDPIDNRIDRALSALRDAHPRSGPDGEIFAGRILASLENRAAHHATNPGGLPFHNVKGWGIARGSARENGDRTAGFALWAATSTAILAIASLAIVHHSGPNKNAVILSERSDSKNPDAARHNANPESFSTTNLAQVAESPRISTRPAVSIGRHPERSVAQRRISVFSSCSDHHSTGCPIHDDNVVMGGVTSTPTNPDAQALADLHAPSHPAPPLPLTPQEKLFLRMLRYGNLTQLAELNPLVRAQQDADETTAFKAFFPDPPPLKQPGDDE